MYHNALISESHPLQADLQKITELVLAFSVVSSVYFSPHLEEGLNEGIILIMIGDGSPHAWDELNEDYWKVFEAFPQFSFRIFSAHWVRDELKNGNPFFAVHCTKNSLIYSTDQSVEFSFVERLRPKRFLKKAKSRFESDFHAAFILGTSLKHYKRSKDYLQAAYNIHQNIRWLFIAASNFLTGEWLNQQDLNVHQKQVGRFSKELAKTFNAEIEGEMQLLELLNAACLAVQNGDEIPGLTAEIIEAAEVKKEWVRTEVSRLFKDCVSRCRYEFSRSKSPLITIEEANPLNQITKIITDTVATSAVYCFGQRSISRSGVSSILDDHRLNFQCTHYYLFLIVRDFQADVPGNVAYNIQNQTCGRYTATIVMHSKKSLYHKSADQQHFFYRVMQRGTLLFKETAAPLFLSFKEAPLRNIQSAKMYWQQRDRTKQYLMEAEALDSDGATKIKVFLMHLVIEQTCLGLIRLFLAYTPNQHNLSFLFDLCEYFTSLTAEIFPRQTQKDTELLKTLSAHVTSLRYGFIDEVPYHDYEVLSNRYYEFVERADKLAANELERLEKLNETANRNT